MTDREMMDGCYTLVGAAADKGAPPPHRQVADLVFRRLCSMSEEEFAEHFENLRPKRKSKDPTTELIINFPVELA